MQGRARRTATRVRRCSDEARPAPLRLNSAISSSSRAAPCSMVSTPASRPARTPSALSMCAAVRRPSLRASSQAACATSGDMRSTPGSPSTSASNTPPVMNSFTRSHLCAKQSRTMARASSGVDATCANRPAPWPPGTVTPTPDATSRGPGYLPASMASRTSTSANPGSPTERTVVTPLASCCCACASKCSSAKPAPVQHTSCRQTLRDLMRLKTLGDPVAQNRIKSR